MAAPAISVLMTVFNGESYIELAAKSALCQTFRDFEFLAIDDGSTDGTLEILARLKIHDSRVRVIAIGRQGRVAALNRGISEARAPWIAVLDADDVAVPDRLERQMTHLSIAPQVAVLGGAMRYIDGEGHPGRVVCPELTHSRIVAALPRYCPIFHSTVMMRRTDVMAVGGYRPAFPPSEDYDLWLRLADRARFANLPDVLVDYRVHASQVSQTKLQAHALTTLAAQAALRLRRSRSDDGMDSVKEITPADLERLGVSEEQVLASCAWLCLGRARTFIEAGYTSQALAVLETPIPERLSSGVRAELALNRDLLRAEALRMSGHPAAGVMSLASAALNLRAVGRVGLRAARRKLRRS